MKKQENSITAGRLPSDPPANMNVAMAADYIGVSERLVRELIARRALRSVRIGRRVVIRKTDIDAFLEERVS